GRNLIGEDHALLENGMLVLADIGPFLVPHGGADAVAVMAAAEARKTRPADRLLNGGIDFGDRISRNELPESRLPRIEDDLVDLPLRTRCLSEEIGAGDVGNVAADRAAAIQLDGIAGPQRVDRVPGAAGIGTAAKGRPG